MYYYPSKYLNLVWRADIIEKCGEKNTVNILNFLFSTFFIVFFHSLTIKTTIFANVIKAREMTNFDLVS